MYRTAFVAALLFSSFPLIAQNQSSATSTANAVLSAKTNMALSANSPANSAFAGGCPVSMDARQGVWDHTIRVHNGQNEKIYNGIGQRISLTLIDIHSARIVAATVKVLGLSGQNRVLNTSAISSAKPDASRIIQLTSFSAAKSGVTAELYAPGFTSVTSIQLLEVTYADGSTMSNPHLKMCQVAPDPLMLVDARQ